MADNADLQLRRKATLKIKLLIMELNKKQTTDNLETAQQAIATAIFEIKNPSCNPASAVFYINRAIACLNNARIILSEKVPNGGDEVAGS